MSDPQLPDGMRRAMGARDTGPAKLPAIPVVKTGDTQIDNAFRKMKEWFDVRDGAAGNPWEKAVTLRDIKDVTLMAAALKAQPASGKPGDLTISVGGGVTATVAVDAFEKAIRELPLYKDLIKRLDDPSRFDNLPQEVREIVLKSIADEALTRGTEIKEINLKQQGMARAIAIWGREITAAVANAAAGVRTLEWATAETNFAQAGKITQLEASLGNYYQDGKPGRASLEQQMTVTVDRVAGLSAQYTLKVQAGGALAGYGIAATESNGVPSSAFIIMADKFAIVSPTYTGGMTTAPPANTIPFGVDANGIYMNSSVYIKGSMRVDSAGRTLADGMRGGVNINAVGSSWSDNVARQAVWAAIGKSGTATTNNHLVIGDQVMISNASGTFSQARMWSGTAWISPGVVINGDMVVPGSISASKINTNGLEVRDASGNVIFSSGVPLNVSRVQGLGALATQDFTWVGNLRWSNSTVVQESQLVSSNNPIRPENVGTFLSGAIIDTAYIKYGAVQTLQVAGGTITSMMYGVGADKTITAGDATAYVDIDMPAGSSGVVLTGITSVTSTDANPSAAGWAEMEIWREGAGRIGNAIKVAGKTFDPWTSVICVRDPNPPAGTIRYWMRFAIIANYNGEYKPLVFRNNMITAIGGKR